MATRALLTDLDPLSMGYAYWRSGAARDEAVFHFLFRKPRFERLVNPHRRPVGLELGLFELKTRVILDARGGAA